MKDKHNLYYIDVVRSPLGRDMQSKIIHYSCEYYSETYTNKGYLILGLINGGQTDMEILIENEDTEVFVMNLNGKTLKVFKGECPIIKSCGRNDISLQELLTEVGIAITVEDVSKFDNEEYGQAVDYAKQKDLFLNAIPEPIKPKFLEKFIVFGTKE
ncbi:MAG: hypothetical protein KAS32_04100 [Candidatus Peribacteraceae bacterium]|nr:hypothetical protein [Candidatus Peribacteraceae bacterium]